MAIDPAFGVNNFLQAKFYNESETVANNFMTLLFGKPGFYPSIPELGIDVESMIYDFFDDLDPEVIKQQVSEQCYKFMDYIVNDEFRVEKKYYNEEPLLLFVLPLQEKETTRHFALGITTSFTEGIRYNFTWAD